MTAIPVVGCNCGDVGKKHVSELRRRHVPSVAVPKASFRSGEEDIKDCVGLDAFFLALTRIAA